MNFYPINEELYEKTKIFVISALKWLMSYLQKGEKIPARMVEKYNIEKKGWTITHEVGPLGEPYCEDLIEFKEE